MDRDQEYEVAKQWLNNLTSQPVAVVTHRPPAGKVFIDVVIEGQRFQGRRDGNTLYIVFNSGGCALGVASINQAKLYDHMPLCWQICKYGNEAKGELQLTSAGRRALAITFGLPIVPEAPGFPVLDLFEREHFYDSPAFASLHKWASTRPQRLADAFGDTYLGLWPLAALEGSYVPPTPDNVARARARIDGRS